MKKTIFIFMAVSILVSCGPHRMKCGPKRRCVSVEKIDSQSKPKVVKI